MNALLMAVAVALLLVWGGREVSLRGEVRSTPEQRQAAYVAAVDASLDAQLAALGCDDRRRLSDLVAVRNAARTKAGAVQFDTTVVRVTTFDNAWAAAQRGEVYVVGWCS